MHEALYYGKKITASEIDAVNYQEKYKKNISCCSENCEAKLVWVVGRKGGASFFRNANYEVHVESCRYFTTEEKKVPNIKSVNTTNSYTQRQVRNKHNYARQLLKQEQGKIQKRTYNKNGVKRSKYTINKDKKTIVEKNSLSLDGKLLQDNSRRLRAASSHVVKPKQITPALIGKALTVVSNQAMIERGAQEHMLVSIDDDKTAIKLSFPEAFINNAGGMGTAHELLKAVVVAIENKLCENDLELCITGVLVRKKDGIYSYALPVLNPSFISVNGKNPYDLIQHME